MASAMAKDEANAKIEAEKLAIENDEDVTDKFQENVEQQEKINKQKLMELFLEESNKAVMYAIIEDKPIDDKLFMTAVFLKLTYE